MKIHNILLHETSLTDYASGQLSTIRADNSPPREKKPLSPRRKGNGCEEYFDWKIAEPHWDYREVTTGSDTKPGIHGGIALGPSDYPHGTRVVIEVDSLDDTLAKAVESGAKIVRDKMEFDEFYLAYLADPVGLGIGLIQYK